MGLLEKRNPWATRRSAIAWAAGCGIFGGLAGLLFWSRSDMPPTALFFLLPFMLVFSSIAGGAMEWQLPEGPDEDY